MNDPGDEKTAGETADGDFQIVGRDEIADSIAVTVIGGSIGLPEVRESRAWRTGPADPDRPWMQSRSQAARTIE